MNIDLANKNALVTGGATGIGRASALALAGAGATLAVADLNESGAQETIDQIGRGLAVACDVRELSSIAAMRDKVHQALGGIDILVCSAGLIQYSKGIESVSVEQWDTVLEVNLRGTFLTCQAFVRDLKARRNGRIITFSSMAARVGGMEVGANYTASKAGIIGLTRTLAKECGESGTTANALAPGVILTGPVQKQVMNREHEYAQQIPLRRLGRPEEIADVVAFLASPQASYINGVILDVNGGMYMS